MVDTDDLVRRRFRHVWDDRRPASERQAVASRFKAAAPRSRDEIHKFKSLEFEADMAVATDRLFEEKICGWRSESGGTLGASWAAC